MIPCGLRLRGHCPCLPHRRDGGSVGEGGSQTIAVILWVTVPAASYVHHPSKPWDHLGGRDHAYRWGKWGLTRPSPGHTVSDSWEFRPWIVYSLSRRGTLGSSGCPRDCCVAGLFLASTRPAVAGCEPLGVEGVVRPSQIRWVDGRLGAGICLTVFQMHADRAVIIKPQRHSSVGDL